jgi:hypothetical protein
MRVKGAYMTKGRTFVRPRVLVMPVQAGIQFLYYRSTSNTNLSPVATVVVSSSLLSSSFT